MNTDENGEFSTSVPGLFDTATYITQIVNRRDRVLNGKIILYEDIPYGIGNRFRNCIKQVENKKIKIYYTILEDVKAEKEKMRTIMLKEVSITGRPGGTRAGLRKFSESGIYGTADNVIDINEQEYKYNSITDAIVKNVPGFMITTDNMDPGNFKLLLHGPHSFNFSESPSNSGAQDPLFIVDGVELRADEAYDILKTISPGQVEKIEVFKFESAVMWGARGANGVIVIYTKQGEDNSSRERSVLNIKGFNLERSFYPSEKDSTGITLDKRITVYWAGNLSTDSNGKVIINFENTSNANFFTIHVEGITADGIPFSYTKRTDH